jgi:signal transduction histidine kinase
LPLRPEIDPATSISPPPPSAFDGLRRIGAVSCAGAAVVGLAVLVGWYAQLPAVLKLIPGAVAMQFNTALALLLGGTGAVAALRGRPAIAMACGAGTALIGGVTLMEYATGRDLLLDRLQWAAGVSRDMAEYARVKTSAPGRMAPNTATAFVLAGAAVIALSRRGASPVRHRAAAALGALCAGIALIALLGYAGGATSAYAWGTLAQMAVHTALGLVLLGGGAAAAALARHGEGGRPVTAELPWLAALAGTVVTLGLWNALADQEHRYIRASVRQSAETVASELALEVNARVLALVRLSGRWALNGRPSRAEWEHQAEMNLAHFPGYRAIDWAGADARVRWVVPLRGNEPLLGVDLRAEPNRRQALDAALAAGAPRMTRAVTLVTGGTGFLVAVPARTPSGSDGWVVGVFNARALMDTVLASGSVAGYRVAVREGGAPLYGPGGAAPGGWGHEVRVPLYGREWRVRAWPEAATLRAMRSRSPLLALLLGGAMTALLWWALAQFHAARVREREAAATSARLSREAEIRLRAERELAAKAAELERSNRELEQFAYVASHDLQEPLRKIQAFGDLLVAEAGEAMGADARDYVARMRAAAVRMQALIQDLLAFSRISRGDPPALVDLGRVAREVVSDLDGRVRGTGGTVEVGDLPVLRADPTQMRQLLQNLIANALKFHRPGVPPRVSVEGRCDPPGSAGAACRIWVRDNGIGFDEKYLDRIFTPFQRLHGRGEFEGTGMGLAICRKIVERHGGKITARSTPGEGTTFRVTLPTDHDGSTR